jgi:hypothetical protein
MHVGIIELQDDSEAKMPVVCTSLNFKLDKLQYARPCHGSGG